MVGALAVIPRCGVAAQRQGRRGAACRAEAMRRRVPAGDGGFVALPPEEALVRGAVENGAARQGLGVEREGRGGFPEHV